VARWTALTCTPTQPSATPSKLCASVVSYGRDTLNELSENVTPPQSEYQPRLWAEFMVEAVRMAMQSSLVRQCYCRRVAY